MTSGSAALAIVLQKRRIISSSRAVMLRTPVESGEEESRLSAERTAI
jgi:hypothetical protein